MSDPVSLEILRSIDKKMDQMIKLLALNSVKGLDELQQMQTLRSLGLSSDEIGAFLGVTGSAVRHRLSDKNSKSKKGAKNDK